MKFEIKTALRFEAELGECPVWAARENALYFADIKKRAFYRLRPDVGLDGQWNLPEEIGCFALRESGGFIAALRTGIFLLDRTGQIISQVAPNPDDPEKSRFNDGCVDPWGRFWCGTMWEGQENELKARILRVDEHLNTEIIAGDLNITNGLAFSPDRRWVYYSDTGNNILYRQALDPNSGRIIGPREKLRHFGDGRPDGAAVDVEGNYWSAQYGGARVERLGPDGRTLDIIDLPVPKPTMTAFGGPDLRTLYITTAREELTGEELNRHPGSGSIYQLHSPVPGLPVPNFKG